MIAVLLGLILGTEVQAADRTLPSEPGLAFRLVDCTSMGRRCWAKAPSLRQFEDARGHAIRAQVKIVRHDHHLVVRVGGLSEAQTVEVVVRRPNSMVPSDAQLIQASNGTTMHRLEGPVNAAAELGMHIQIWDEDTATVHTWDPGSGARFSEPVTAWSAPEDQTEPSITVHTDEENWWVDTVPGAVITVRHRRPFLPTGGRGIHKPWTVEVQRNEPFAAPPHTGSYDVTVRHRGALSKAIVSWVSPAATTAEQLGIHPPPRTLHLTNEPAFELGKHPRICASDRAQRTAAEWLGNELQRIAPISPSLSCESADIRFGIDADLPAEGYSIRVRPEGIQIQSRTAAGALYAAIATADLLGTESQAAAVDITDAPAIATRILFHEVSPQHGPMVRPEQTIDFIEKVVARARFNTLILELKGGLQYQSHPELSRRDAWSHAELRRVISAAQRHGITVIPAINSPAHANWITSARPELMEESTQALLCTRHPATRVLLSDLYAELHELFGKPAFVHVGHDEIRWRTRWKHESQRCPRCAATPRWALLTNDLIWTHTTLGFLGAKPMVWSDMLVPGWHGAWDQMHRAALRIPESIRPDIHVISWGRTGDTVGTLTPLGYAVIRGNTGYADWKRPGLQSIARGVAGEALALFNATPWSSFQGTAGPTRDYHHWSNVILAGATAWNPSIETIPIDTSVDALRNHPAYRPGLTHTPEWHSSLKIDETLTDGETRQIPLEGQTLSHIEVWQAARYDRSNLGALAKDNRKARSSGGLIVGRATIEYADGQTVELDPVRLGMHTEHPDRNGRGSLLFGSSRTQRTADTTAYAVHWQNPHANRTVRSLSLTATRPDVEWIVNEVLLAKEPTTTP